MSQFTLSQAELAILLSYLAEDRTLLKQTSADLGLAPEQARLVEAQLHERGLLVADCENSLMVLEALSALLEATLNPATLAILSLTHREQNQVPLYFSFTSAGCVLNCVNAQGQHQFASLASLDAAVETIVRCTALPRLPADPAPRFWSDLQAEARLAAALLVIKEPALAQAPPQALRWVELADQVWLADPAAVHVGRPVTQAQLREQVSAALHSAVTSDLRLALSS